MRSVTCSIWIILQTVRVMMSLLRATNRGSTYRSLRRLNSIVSPSRLSRKKCWRSTQCWFETRSLPLSIKTWECYIPMELKFVNVAPITGPPIVALKMSYIPSRHEIPHQHRKDSSRVSFLWLIWRWGEEGFRWNHIYLLKLLFVFEFPCNHLEWMKTNISCIRIT